MAANGLFSALFPSDCRLCGASLTTISRLPVCGACLAGMQRLNIPTCELCGERLFHAHLDGADVICGLCRRLEPPFARAAAYAEYTGGLRELIQLLKYDGVRPAADVLGRMLAEVIETLAADFGKQPPLVAVVPLHGTKQRHRGFNQAELIARAALRILRAGGRELEFAPSALARTRDTQSQTGLTRHQRRANLRGAFVVNGAIRGRDILLVDDVLTTGATAGECARVLRRAGAERVLVATVARALKPDVARIALPQEIESDEISPEVKTHAAHA
jgi:ComF family protein